MTTRNGVLLTAADVEGWRQERAQLEKEIEERAAKLNAVKRKLDAAEIFAATISETGAPTDAPALPHEQRPEDVDADEDEADSAAEKLCANMRETGASLKTKQIRARLVELGFGEKIKQKPNYVYGLVYRLNKRGRLIRRGSKYRAAPLESSKEETGVVGTPARH